MGPYIVMGIVAYLIGSINFSVIISKKFAGFDLREKGSGNAGSTNVLRTVGKKAALITLILDILKGIVAIVLAFLMGKYVKDIDNPSLLIQIAGILVIIGHTFPIFFGFKGGKGVDIVFVKSEYRGKGIATSLGVLLITNGQIGVICLTFALVLIVLTRMVSVGSIAAAILFPVLTLYIGKEFFIVPGETMSYLIFSIILAVIVIFNHRANIKRIADGTENRISFSKK